jgi:hypothetical protein
MDANEFNRELGLLRQAVSRAEAATRRTRWRLAMQARSTRVARVLRYALVAVRAPGATRTKAHGKWTIAVDGDAVLTITTRTLGRSLEDLAAPLTVHVLRDDLVARHLLDELALDGSIAIEG